MSHPVTGDMLDHWRKYTLLPWATFLDVGPGIGDPLASSATHRQVVPFYDVTELAGYRQILGRLISSFRCWDDVLLAPAIVVFDRGQEIAPTINAPEVGFYAKPRSLVVLIEFAKRLNQFASSFRARRLRRLVNAGRRGR